MLDANDLKAIEQLFEKKFDRIDERFDAIDKHFEEVDERFDAIDKQFDAIDKHFDAIDKRFEKVDDRFTKMEKKLIREMDKRIRASENLLLETMDYDRKVLEERIEKLTSCIEQLEQHSRIVKHDENMTELILRKIEELQNEMEILKLKIA